MIIFRHRKTDEASFLSHIDAMRVLQRAMRRMHAEVKYSAGFVPHMLTYSTTPLPLGVQSIAEYFVADSPLTGEEELLERFNASVPEGLKADFAAVTASNPNLAAKVTASLYEINAKEKVSEDVLSILDMSEYYMKQFKKGQELDVEVRKKIYSIEIYDDKLRLIAATGNENLRVDSFVQSLARFGVRACANDVTRIEQLVSVDGGFVAAKEILK